MGIDAMLDLDIDLLLVEEVMYLLLSAQQVVMDKDDTLCSRMGGFSVILNVVRLCARSCMENELFQHLRPMMNNGNLRKTGANSEVSCCSPVWRRWRGRI